MMTFGSSRFFTSGRFSTLFIFHLPGGAREVRGIFDNAFYDRNFGENNLETTSPRITAAMVDVAGIPAETMVQNAATKEWYSVIQIQPDGTGMAAVVLAHEAEPEEDDEEPEDEEEEEP